MGAVAREMAALSGKILDSEDYEETLVFNLPEAPGMRPMSVRDDGILPLR
jgi:hypothetical protein